MINQDRIVTIEYRLCKTREKKIAQTNVSRN